VTCNGTTVSSGLSWTGAPTWSNPAAGTYSGVSVSASSGDCNGKTATCSGTLTVAPVLYTVTYNAGTGVTGVTLPANQTKTKDVALMLSAAVPTRTGYVFASWNTLANGTGMSYAPGANYTDNADLMLYAQWTANTYTVTYNANDGTGAPANQTKTYDIALTLSTSVPTRTGYTFAGWNTSANGTGTSYVSGASYTSNAGITLYAQWTINTYTVTYNANDGTGAPTNQTKTYNVTLTLSADVPTRTGYTFANWNTSADGKGTSYASGASYITNASITLYAQWKANTYTVTYNANDGAGVPTNQTKTHDVALTLSTVVPIRTGYVFTNWNTSANGNGTSYASGASYTDNASVTLYAQWTVNTYTVTYNANDGTGEPASQTKTHDVTLTLSTSVPTRTGYDFVGWNTSSNGSGTSYASGASYTANAGVTLYAQWSKPVVSNCNGQTFNTVEIGTQTWMAENLNCNVNGSKCHSNSEANCDKYGRLYNWATAMALPSSCNSTTCASQVNAKHRGICPSGWHIPSDADWNVLMKYVNPSCYDYSSCAGAGTKLKATSGWYNGNGEDTHGFSALPGGSLTSVGGIFAQVGQFGFWWSASENNSGFAYIRTMRYHDEDVDYNRIDKLLLYSVRCLQD
jgi:uncharacterized protein (TIGR02145 family)/uncharacterized repeat protein (TIGR02543 family)